MKTAPRTVGIPALASESQGTALAEQWLANHAQVLENADAACRARTAFTPYIESPRAALHPAGAKERGQDWFTAVQGTQFPGTAPQGAEFFLPPESSPFTQEELGVRYARPASSQIFAAITTAAPDWALADPQERVGVCLEALDRLHNDVFGNAFATMHTTGQPFIMAFAGSGANSLDRGLEAVVYAARAMADVTPSAEFRRSFGAAEVTLTKRYRIRPRGVGVVIACGSYPAWNAYPAIFANLATGNPVIVKPHPTSILPVARAVQIIRAVITEAGYDPNLIIMALDTPAEPIANTLIDHPNTAIVDFTGSPQYGQELEQRADRLVFTETAGTNAVILESAGDLDAVLQALARSLCLFSGQMCTTPQNIFVSPTVRTPAGAVPYSEVQQRLLAAIDAVLADPRIAGGTCGAIHNPATISALDALAASVPTSPQDSADRSQGAVGAGVRVLRHHTSYPHPEFPAARTCTPLVLEADPQAGQHRAERFGPVSFLIPVQNRDEALDLAATDAAECGAIASYCYTTDPEFADAVETAFFNAGASIGFNLVRQAPLNFTAAFSDYHVTGLNPAGNATLTDLAFMANRFGIVQSKTELPGR